MPRRFQIALERFVLDGPPQQPIEFGGLALTRHSQLVRFAGGALARELHGAVVLSINDQVILLDASCAEEQPDVNWIGGHFQAVLLASFFVR